MRAAEQRFLQPTPKDGAADAIRSEVMMNILQFATSAVLLVALAAALFAGIRGPGQYCGVVVYDRWDGCMLYSGIYVMYVSENIKAELRDHAGVCVQIDAKRVHQPVNPGDGLITELVYLGPAPPANDWALLDGLGLHVAPAFANGERPNVKILIQNSSEKDVEVFASELAPTCWQRKARKAPSSHLPMGPRSR